MKKNINKKLIFLFIFLVAILCASIFFGTFEPFVGAAPGIGQGIGIGQSPGIGQGIGVGSGVGIGQGIGIGQSPGIGSGVGMNQGIVGSGMIAQKAKNNLMTTGSVLPNNTMTSMSTTTENFWAPETRFR